MKTITADYLVASYDANHKPCAVVRPDEPFTIETHDRIPEMQKPAQLTESFKDPFAGIYSVTGPVFVDGAKPGDTLRVDILGIELTHKQGIICAW